MGPAQPVSVTVVIMTDDVSHQASVSHRPSDAVTASVRARLGWPEHHAIMPSSSSSPEDRQQQPVPLQLRLGISLALRRLVHDRLGLAGEHAIDVAYPRLFSLAWSFAYSGSVNAKHMKTVHVSRRSTYVLAVRAPVNYGARHQRARPVQAALAADL